MENCGQIQERFLRKLCCVGIMLRSPRNARPKEKVDKPQQDVVYWEHLEKRLYLCCLEMQAAVPFLEGGWGGPQIYFRKTGGADKCA